MAVITAQGISSVALELLRRTLVLPMTCTRPPGREFSGPNGATISVRIRQTRTAGTHTPGSPANFVGLDEESVDVTVAHIYDGVKINDEDLTLSIENYAQQVTAPQVAAVATGAEDVVATKLNGLAPVLEGDTADAKGLLLQAREDLTNAGAPLGNRWVAASPEFITALLDVDELVRVDASGAPSALRDASLGRLFGLQIVESPGLTAGTAHAYHQSGVVFANRPPALPAGAADAAIANDGGLGLRVVRDFDPGVLADVSIVSTFAGAAIVYEDGDDATDLKRVVSMSIDEGS